MVLLQCELGLEVVRLRLFRDTRRTTTVVEPNKELVVLSSPQTVTHHIGRQIDRTSTGGLLSGNYPRWVRMLALISVVLDTSALVGELCALRLEDLSPALDEVRITRRQHSRRPHTPDVVEVYRLRWATREALQRWLFVRRLLLGEALFATDALWIPVPRTWRPRRREPGSYRPATPFGHAQLHPDDSQDQRPACGSRRLGTSARHFGLAAPQSLRARAVQGSSDRRFHPDCPSSEATGGCGAPTGRAVGCGVPHGH
jgi:hypothetical protein